METEPRFPMTCNRPGEEVVLHGAGALGPNGQARFTLTTESGQTDRYWRGANEALPRTVSVSSLATTYGIDAGAPDKVGTTAAAFNSLGETVGVWRAIVAIVRYDMAGPPGTARGDRTSL